MKKLLCTLTAIAVTATSAFASPIDGIKYIGFTDNAAQYNDTYVAADKDTGRLIPLSDRDYSGYMYAYAPGSDAIAAEMVTPVTFSDVEEYEFGINEMSARGVMTGNGDGTFSPDQALTRAEMAAVFARLFSVENTDDKSIYADVADDSWYKGVVMALHKIGVFVADEKFNPDDKVTREQFMAMTYRMLTYMKYEFTDDANVDPETLYKDFDKVTDFAREAYIKLRKSEFVLIYDYENTENPLDSSYDIYMLNPQNNVTRRECADFMYFFIRDFIEDNAPAIKKADAPSEEIPVLDGSTSTYEITWNIYNAYYLNSHNLDTMPKVHSKTANSYKRLIDGEVEMIFVPDPSEDITKYAEEKGVKLKFVPIANEALVFFTDKNNKADNITTDQARDIYVNDAIKNWKELGGDDKALVAYCRNNDSGSHAQMEKFILDGKSINENISKENISYAMASILTDVDDYNSEHTDSIAMGYSLYYYFNMAQMLLGPTNLKMMSVDGIAPSDDTIGEGKYPYTTNYYAVVRDEKNEKVDKFIDLMKGDFGKEIISQSGLGVMK